MTTFNPLYYTYATRRNAPLPDTSTTQTIRKSYLWMLKAMLKDEIGTGTMAGVRTPASVWTHVASSDSVSYSTTTDLWGPTFDASKIVFNTVPFSAFNGPQSWIILENTTIGYQMCISACWSADANAGITFAPISSPFVAAAFAANLRPWGVGGSATSPGSAFAIGSEKDLNNYSYGWNRFYMDLTPNNPYWAHLVTNSVDGQFWFLVNRGGVGCFNLLLGFQKTVDNDPSDTQNVFALCSGDTPNYQSARGAGRQVYFISEPSSFTGKNKDGSNMGAGNNGGLGPNIAFGNPSVIYTGGYGIDALSGNYLAFPVTGMSYTPTAYRGRFPDLYSIGLAQVGAGIPVGGPGQQRIVVGDVVIPFVGGSPNL